MSKNNGKKIRPSFLVLNIVIAAVQGSGKAAGEDLELFPITGYWLSSVRRVM